MGKDDEGMADEVEQQVLDAIRHVQATGEGYGRVEVIIKKGKVVRIAPTTVSQLVGPPT